MDKVLKFLKDAETYYLATVEGDQPRVRPFGTVHVFEGKLYIQTGKVKDVSKQLHQNPKAEICAFKNGEWLRVSGKLIEDDRNEARQSMLDAYQVYKRCIKQMMAIRKFSILKMLQLFFHHLFMNQKLLNFNHKLSIKEAIIFI